MKIPIHLPCSAFDLENTIRRNCSHYGYPGAMCYVEGDSLILKLNDPKPLPTPATPAQESSVPHIFC